MALLVKWRQRGVNLDTYRAQVVESIYQIACGVRPLAKPQYRKRRKDHLMNKLTVIVLLGCLFAVPASAQQGGQAQQAPPTVAGFVRNLYMGVKNNIVRAGDKMPEEFYGLRPGSQEEVRTFGQHLAHVANYNYLWCSQARGEKNPSAGVNLEKTLTSKADIMKALNDSYAFCDPAYAALTDASGAEPIDITQENGRQVHQTRMGLLMLNVAHNNEVYGSIVTTLRIKNIVPPSSEPRPQQPAQQQRPQ
jgi:uncharacterized damage-inducible protein DinB